MSEAVLNVVIGLITSVVSGGSVWVWKRVSSARVLHRKQVLLGLRPGAPCVIILNSHWQMPSVTEHGDVHAIIELAMLAEESGRVNAADTYGYQSVEVAADLSAVAFQPAAEETGLRPS